MPLNSHRKICFACICLYLLTGGVAKYITLLMEAKAFNKTAMINYALSEGSPFLTEGKDMLISEFGKDYANYFSILSLIAEGKTTQREIDSIINKKHRFLFSQP